MHGSGLSDKGETHPQSILHDGFLGFRISLPVPSLFDVKPTVLSLRLLHVLADVSDAGYPVRG